MLRKSPIVNFSAKWCHLSGVGPPVSLFLVIPGSGSLTAWYKNPRKGSNCEFIIVPFQLITMPIPRTSIFQIYSKRLPYLLQWGTGMAFFLGWPHAYIGISNKLNNVPPINTAYF